MTSIFSKVAELTVQLAKQEVSEPELNCVGRDQQQTGQHSVKVSEQAVHAESVTEQKASLSQSSITLGKISSRLGSTQ